MPRANGIDSLVWILPIAVLVISISGLGAAFRRWKKQNQGDATSEDIALVEKLLASDPTDEENV